MQRQVYIRFEERSNNGAVLKHLERLCVFEDQDDEDCLTEILEDWSVETAKSFATIMHMSRDAIKKMRQERIKRLVS